MLDNSCDINQGSPELTETKRDTKLCFEVLLLEVVV